MTIKHRGRDYLSLPDAFETALSKINAAALDVIKLYGEKQFLDAEFTFILNRTDIQSGLSQREAFTHWHDHISNGETSDIIYLFSDKAGTECQLNTHRNLKVTETQITAPDGTIIRMGGEIKHRSKTVQQNVRREWGALNISLEKPRPNKNANHRSENNAMVPRDSFLFERFRDAATNILSHDQKNLNVLSTPLPLLEFVNTHECS